MTVEITPKGTRGIRVPGVFKKLSKLHPLLYKLIGGRGQGKLVVLTTVGAKSGHERSATVASFPEDENSWLIVGSFGGAVNHPSWYVNLAKNPAHVFLQAGGERFLVRPTSLHGEERAVAWERITTEAPNFATYQTHTDREIPVVRLTRDEGVTASLAD